MSGTLPRAGRCLPFLVSGLRFRLVAAFCSRAVVNPLVSRPCSSAEWRGQRAFAEKFLEPDGSGSGNFL